MGGFRVTARQRNAVIVLAAFAALPPFLTRATPGFLTDYWSSILAAGACYAAMALSLNLLMGYAGQISLGHGALLGVGAYASGIIAGRYYLPMGLGLVVAAALGGAVAFVVGLPALRLRGLYLAITTIAFTVLMEASVFQISWLSRGSAGVEIPRPYIGSFGFTKNADYLALVLVFVVLFWLLDANVVRTKLGRAFFGIREDEQVAQSFGVDTVRYKLFAFVLSGALAGVAGALYGHLFLFVNSETFRFDRFSLPLVVWVVVGGLGSRVGVVAAAGLFAVLPRWLQSLMGDSFLGWDLIVGSALLIVAVARHPGGFAQAIREAREARGHRQAKAGDAPDPAEGQVPKLPNLPRPASLPERPALTPGAALLEVRDVRVRFGGLKAVDGASLTVQPGQIVGLIGPNGAGKSTLFNAISGFVRLDGGRVSFLGQEIQGLPPHARARLGIGRTFQNVGLARNLTVVENLLLAQHLVAGYDPLSALAFAPNTGRVEEELHERARETVAALGFEHLADLQAKNLSGGQQRIVEMACALITAPELLMLDEPSAGMAPAAVENLALRLRDLRDELGRTVLLIEHHIPLVLDVCDYVYVLNFGEVLAHGTPAEITRNREVIGAYLGEDVAALAEPELIAASAAAPARRPRRRVTA